MGHLTLLCSFEQRIEQKYVQLAKYNLLRFYGGQRYEILHSFDDGALF